jgi:insecticidal toxin complex protein TccC
LNPDPAGDVDGLNFYCMVQSNPVSFKDDDGRQSDFSKYYKPEQGDLIFGLAKVLDQGYLSWRAALTGRGDYLAKYLDGDDIARLEKGLDPLRHSYSSIRDSTRRLALSSPGTNDNGSSNRFWEGQYSSVAELVFRKEGKYYENIKTRYGGGASTAANSFQKIMRMRFPAVITRYAKPLKNMLMPTTSLVKSLLVERVRQGCQRYSTLGARM